MALPPTVPTSFVPKQPVQTTRRAKRGSGNLFTFVSLIVMGVAVTGAVATFVYQQILQSVRDTKAEELAAAEASINRETIEEFLRLQNRLSAAGSILDTHIAASQFLDVIETITLQSVAFETLTLSVNEDRSAKITMEGSARSFNALAAQSAAFAAEKRIKRAIFSDIGAGQNGLVSFRLSAEVAPELITWDGEGTLPPPQPEPAAATTTQP